MSRKSRRNSLKNAAQAQRTPALRLPCSTLGLSGLALGSMALAVHAQDAPLAKNADASASTPKSAPTARQPKSLRSKLTRLADTRPAGGAGLVAQADQGAAAPPASSNVPAPSTSTAASAQQLQEIVVTGIRGSLQRSLQIKRLSLGVVDAISAEDIGQFPDSSVGQAIGRIPGVTVDRGTINQNSSAGAPTATGNVTGITVRGFGTQFNELLVEGRPMASGNGQSTDFGALGANYIGEVDVLKTPDFALSTGAVGATINVKFPNPFDHPGLHAQAFVSGTDYELDGGIRPAFGALLSDTFADGKFGILIDGDYSDHHILAHHQDVVGWKGTHLTCENLSANFTTAFGSTGCALVGAAAVQADAAAAAAAKAAGQPAPATPTSAAPSWYPQDMAMYLERTDSRRKDGRVALQWHPDDNVLVTIDDNYSSDDERAERFQRSTWFGSFSNVVEDPNGTITSFINDGGNAPTDFNSFIATDYIVTNTPGINVIWDVTDNLTAELDADQSMAHLNPNNGYTDIDADTGFGSNDPVGTNNYNGGLVTSQNPKTLPYWSAIGPNSNAANYNGLNPFVIGSHVLPLQAQRNSDKVNQVKLDATWHTGSTKVNFGAQFVDDNWNSWETDTFDFTGANNYWQLWSGYGPANNSFAYYCQQPVTNSANAYGGANCPTGTGQTNLPAGGPAITVTHGVALPSSMFTAVNLGTWLPGYNSGNLPSSIVEYNPYSVLNYLETQPHNADWNPTSGYPAYTGGVPTMELNAGGVQRVDRKNYAPFVTAEHNFAIGDMTLKADAGLRYERTSVTIAGFAKPVVSVGTQPGDPTAYAFNLGAATLTSVDFSYNYFLPSLDLNLMVQPDLKVRADFSRTETPTTDTNIIPNTTYGGRVNALSATGNNPDLLPYLSNNFDLGAEWYYGSNDYLSVDGFFKHVTQFPVSSVASVTLPIPDPSPRSNNFGKPMVFAETSYTNGAAANVTGVELTLQQMLGWGFGFQINGTYAHTNKNFDNYSLTSNQFALPGVGNSANLIAFYQNYGLQARLAVQWQGDYLLTDSGQEQGGGAFGNEPVYLASSTEVDFSTTYDFTSHLSGYFEALNLTDSVYHTYGRFKNQTLNVVDYGRSFTLGVRAKF